MIETEVRLYALVRYAMKKNRPLSLREYRYVLDHIRYRRFQRGHAYFCLFVGFSAIVLGGLALSTTPFSLVVMLGGTFLNLLAAEDLDPRSSE